MEVYLKINDIDKFTMYGEHKDKLYYAYLDFFPKGVNFVFRKRIDMEEFIYSLGFERFIYKSSNGKSFSKKWEYISEELEDWMHWYGTKTKPYPKKYGFDDFMCGHFVKEK